MVVLKKNVFEIEMEKALETPAYKRLVEMKNTVDKEIDSLQEQIRHDLTF